ncbi:MAG: dynamin family protein [Myxococcales bacterium]|nr:dynamin family protein [Myxococcales bacterium]MCB9704480.1 dynamin family protein [Myxococcales bacterium]
MSTRPEIDSARRLASIADELGLAAAGRAILLDTHRRLDQATLRILVIGEIKHGKSSLINALVGEKILPTGVTPTTGAVVRLHHGEATERRLIHPDGRIEGLSDERFAALARGRERAEGVVDATWSGDQLPVEAELIDTPGVNDINRLRSLLSRGELPGADVLVLVLDATQALSRSELGFLRDALVAVGGLGDDSGARLLVAINRIDLVADHERELVAAHLERELSALLGSSTFELFETNAKLALKEPASEEHGVRELLRLRARLIELAGLRDEILPRRARASLRRHAHLLVHNAAIQARALSLEEQALADELAAVRAALAEQEVDFDRLRGQISAASERILQESRARLASYRAELQAEVLAQLERADLRGITDALPAAIRDATMTFTLTEAEQLRHELETLTRETLQTHGEQARRRLAQATILLGFRGPAVRLEPPSTTIEGGTLAISVAGTAVMYFGNVVAGLLMAIAGPLATMVLREKGIRDLRARAHREIPRALQASFGDLEKALTRVAHEQIAALEEHLVLANAQLGEQLVAVLDRAALALQAPPEGDDPEPPRHRARARLHAIEKELEAILAELENPATSTSPERTR